MAERKQINSPRVQPFNIWQKLHSLAAQVTALLAIAGFVYSFITANKVSKTSQETSNTLERITASLGSVTYPIVQIDDYQFVVSRGEKTEGKIDCNNSPTGIFISYKNKSNVPIQTHRTDGKVFFGNLQIGEAAIFKIAGSQNSIMIPGGILSFGFSNDDVFREQLKIPGRLAGGPHIEVKFEIEYSRINEKKRYLYKVHKVIPFECNNAHIHISNSKLESIEEIN